MEVAERKRDLMLTLQKTMLICAVAVFTASVAQAGTITIAQDSNAAVGNFQSPGTQATVGYTITTHDDGTNFYVDLVTTDSAAMPFANLYFDTIASTPGTGSNLGFEFGQNAGDAFIPGVSGSNISLPGGLGVSSVFTVADGVTTANLIIPNSFFLINPLGMNVAPTPAGTLVSLHLSQSFGYSVVGGGTNYPAPVELGAEIVGSSVPEPVSIALFGIGLCGIGLLKKFARS